MVKSILLVVLSAAILTLASFAGTPGTFRGVVVQGPASARVKGWIFVQGKNGMLRRVEIQKAKVDYDEEYPQNKRQASPREALKEGVEIRVTAEQGSDGEWHASQIEIVEPGSGTEMPPRADPTRKVT